MGEIFVGGTSLQGGDVAPCEIMSPGGTGREECHVLLDCNFVGEMMHHELLCLTRGGTMERDLELCFEMARLWR